MRISNLIRKRANEGKVKRHNNKAAKDLRIIT